MNKLIAVFELAFCTLSLTVSAAPLSASGRAAKASHTAIVLAAVAPTYPGIALAMPKGGDVVVEISVGPGGEVAKTMVVAGAAPLRRPAVAAARLWRFVPEDAGRRIKLTFSFRVMPKGTPAEDLTPVFRPPCGVEVRRTMPEPVVNYGR